MSEAKLSGAVAREMFRAFERSIFAGDEVQIDPGGYPGPAPYRGERIPFQPIPPLWPTILALIVACLAFALGLVCLGLLAIRGSVPAAPVAMQPQAALRSPAGQQRPLEANLRYEFNLRDGLKLSPADGSAVDRGRASRENADCWLV